MILSSHEIWKSSRKNELFTILKRMCFFKCNNIRFIFFSSISTVVLSFCLNDSIGIIHSYFVSLFLMTWRLILISLIFQRLSHYQVDPILTQLFVHWRWYFIQSNGKHPRLLHLFLPRLKQTPYRIFLPIINLY